MPIANYVYPGGKINIVRSFRTPKRITELDRWLKEVRKVIPECPPFNGGDTGWWLFRQEIDIDKISLEWRNKIEEKSYLVIQRRDT